MKRLQKPSDLLLGVLRDAGTHVRAPKSPEAKAEHRPMKARVVLPTKLLDVKMPPVPSVCAALSPFAAKWFGMRSVQAMERERVPHRWKG